jgi:hypothetical protein
MAKNMDKVASGIQIRSNHAILARDSKIILEKGENIKLSN